MKTFNHKYGPWALVTGASFGIGAKFAKELAVKGLNVVLVARRKDKLKTLAKDIELQHAVYTQKGIITLLLLFTITCAIDVLKAY